MSDQSVEVRCPTHGKSYATFVCQHLARGSGLGFYSADDGTGSDPCPDAWCEECDGIMMQIGEWTEEAEAFAGITLLCAGCYQTIKRRNQKQRPGPEAEGRMEDSTTYQGILEKGRLDEARKLLLRLARKRFKRPSEEGEAALHAITDLDKLEQLGETLMEARSWTGWLKRP